MPPGGVATGGVAVGPVPGGVADAVPDEVADGVVGAGAGVGAAPPGGMGIAPGATVAVPVVIIVAPEYHAARNHRWPEITPPQPHELIVVQVG